jgi:hypothetical protein
LRHDNCWNSAWEPANPPGALLEVQLEKEFDFNGSTLEIGLHDLV